MWCTSKHRDVSEMRYRKQWKRFIYAATSSATYGWRRLGPRLKKRRLVAYIEPWGSGRYFSVWMLLCHAPQGSINYWCASSVCLCVRPSVCPVHVPNSCIEIWQKLKSCALVPGDKCNTLRHFDTERSNGETRRSRLDSIMQWCIQRCVCIFLVTATDVTQVISAWPSLRG